MRVGGPPARPLVLFDGDCGFCRAWIARWEERTGDRVQYAPSQERGAEFPEIPASDFTRSVQLVLPDGEVLSGARAVAKALDLAGTRWPLRVYHHVPLAAPASEAAYRVIAGHRNAASRVTKALWGDSVDAPHFGMSTVVFLRLLGLVFLAAFISVWFQIEGLIGSRGVLPVGAFLAWVRSSTGAERYWLLPTLAWAASSDAALHVFCAAGSALSLVLAFGFFPIPCLAALTALYLSISVAGQTFFGFQWDFLLVETGFLALFLSPFTKRLRAAETSPPPAALFLLRWLLFRLNFSSGVVKLASGDPTWRDLTALSYHYETQPLPPWTAWSMHQLPGGFQKVSTILLFFVELGVPFLIFAPRRLRLAAFTLLVALQITIAATGNYAFFNVLSALLCLLLLDDRVFARISRRPLSGPATRTERQARRWPRAVVAGLAIFVLPVSLLHLGVPMPAPVVVAARAAAPLRLVNGYGLFAVMTTRRQEIVVEGSADGQTWLPYEFLWKPGDVRRRPGFVAPHQPRLDWQMWFAALGDYDASPWLASFEERLLEGSPEVLGLLARNPFPGRPPRFLRARLWDYHFTDRAARRMTGAWWRREEAGQFGPILERK
ncbi:MAG: lipase maturation factor family protein [Acidobacteria bacterium]|nr:lipase maturation factor family protein [Acidobacteriota bacterium]